MLVSDRNPFSSVQDKDVAMRIFDLGLKKYGEEPEYCLAYVNFLTHLNGEWNGKVTDAGIGKISDREFPVDCIGIFSALKWLIILWK